VTCSTGLGRRAASRRDKKAKPTNLEEASKPARPPSPPSPRCPCICSARDGLASTGVACMSGLHSVALGQPTHACMHALGCIRLHSVALEAHRCHSSMAWMNGSPPLSLYPTAVLPSHLSFRRSKRDECMRPLSDAPHLRHECMRPLSDAAHLAADAPQKRCSRGLGWVWWAGLGGDSTGFVGPFRVCPRSCAGSCRCCSAGRRC